MKKLTIVTIIATSALLLAACGNHAASKDSTSSKDKSASVSKAKAKAVSESKAKASSEAAASAKAKAESESQAAASSSAAASARAAASSAAKSSSQATATASNTIGPAPVPAGKTLVKLNTDDQAYALETLEQAHVGLDMGHSGDMGKSSLKGLLANGGFGWENFSGAKGINIYHVYKYSDGTGLVELYSGSIQDSSPYETWPKTTVSLSWAKYPYN